MKNLIITLLLVIYVFNATATITFEKIFDIVNSEEVALSASEDNKGGYVVVVGLKRSPQTQTFNFELLHLNAFGDTIWNQNFTVNYFPEIKVIRRTIDGYAVMGVANDTSQINSYMFWIAKFDTLGNQIWLNYYSDPMYPGNQDKISMEVTSQQNFLIYNGNLSFVSISQNGIVLNTTNIGLNYFSPIYVFQPDLILKKNYNYEFIFGYSLNFPFNIKLKRLSVNEYADTLSSNYILLDSAKGDPFFLKVKQDGFLIFGWGPSNTGNYGFIEKVDSVGNNIWKHKLPNLKYANNYITANATLNNGNIIICGFPTLGFSNRKSFIYCLNDFADSIWYREFSPTDTTLETEFYDVIATRDSGLLACGQMLRPNGSRESYIVKLDANGNLFNPLSVLEKQNESYFHIYPNPASNTVSLHYIGIDNNVSLQIRNAIGQVIYCQKISSNDERIQIDTSQFPSGIYSCSLQSNERIMAIKKLVLVH